MTANQKVALALLLMVDSHLMTQEPTGSLLFQVQEFCEDFEEIRQIRDGGNTQSKEEQQQILLEYARMYNFSREEILKQIEVL